MTEDPGQSENPTPEPQTITLQQALDIAVRHQTADRLSEAESIYRQILQVEPDHPVALHMLGVIAHQMGDFEAAFELIAQVIAIEPDHAGAHNNLGLVLQKLGMSDDAVARFKKSLAINPEYADASYNLGNLFKEQGKFDEAVVNYQKALAIKPDYTKALNNLGVVLMEKNKLEDATVCYRRVIEIMPENVEALNNLAAALQELGQLEEAVANYHKVLDLQPNHLETWNNIKFAVKALHFSQGIERIDRESYKDGFSNSACSTTNFAMHKYYLDSFWPHEIDECLQKAMNALPPEIDEEIIINDNSHIHPKLPRFPDKLVALLHFGRSGTGLLHSLIDGHPEISTLPGIYMRGFFNDGVWGRISAEGWSKLPERFADEFAVLFDAKSPSSTPGRFRENSSFLGDNEGMTNVGENRDESLRLDRGKFCSEVLALMKGLDKINPKSFFQIAHLAFERVLGTINKKNTVFYHIHNPDDFAKLNLVRYFPKTKLVMMIREPVKSCESWIRNDFVRNDYNIIAPRIISMLFDIDQVVFRMQESVGVRLEDLKINPDATLLSLCAWLGIKKTPSLYQMTAQGKKWWGDPSSPDYKADKSMSPFGETNTKIHAGNVFSEKDRFILGTLFYPFSVRFGYTEPNFDGFVKDLKAIRPLLDDMFDFEIAISERSQVDPARFKRRGSYMLLRSGLMDRWNILNEFGDYPHMLMPLEIDSL